MRHGTYSIVALDPETGELGAAVQSHWFSVGSLCTWARPGVGAVATQSVVEPAYGPRALDRLEGGAGAGEAVAALIGADPLAPELRRLLTAVEEGRGALGELASGSEDARAVLAGLGELEFRGLVRRTFGGRYEPAAR